MYWGYTQRHRILWGKHRWICFSCAIMFMNWIVHLLWEEVVNWPVSMLIVRKISRSLFIGYNQLVWAVLLYNSSSPIKRAAEMDEEIDCRAGNKEIWVYLSTISLQSWNFSSTWHCYCVAKADSLYIGCVWSISRLNNGVTQFMNNRVNQTYLVYLVWSLYRLFLGQLCWTIGSRKQWA